MKIRFFSEEDTPLWERFVKSSRNGTLMQLRSFLNYHPKDRFEDASLMVLDQKGDLVAVVPAAVKHEEGKKVLCSHPGASHGGIIVGHNIKTAAALTAVEKIKDFVRSHGFTGIEIKNVPRIYYKWPCDEIDYALRYHGFIVARTELATAVPLGRYHEKKSDSSTLRSARKAVKNQLTVRESSELQKYWVILRNNLASRHHAKPTHTYEEIVDLSNRFPDKVKLFGVYRQENLIAGTLVFILNERVLNCFYIAHDENYQQLRPLNLLFYQLIKWGIKQGYQYLDWGISTEDGGKKINAGLFNFKEGFGGRGVLREIYRLNFAVEG